MSIYHEYDIRGLYPSELDEETAHLIGKAYVQIFKIKKLAVGADMRTSSPSLKHALIRGVLEMGCSVIDIGLCSTPMIYYVSRYYDALMITASHNPSEYNGMKLCRKGCKVVGRREGLARIEKLIGRVVAGKSKFKKVGNQKRKVKRTDYKKEYVEFLLGMQAKKQKELKVVVDAGNGMAGLFASLVFKHFPVNLIPMYFRLDGKFPNHVPNPIIDKNLIMLRKRVKKRKADLGIAFDADVDRVRFIDDKGRAINPDVTLALFADYFLKKKGKRILQDPTCGKIVSETVKGRGKLLISKVGHSNFTNAMRKNKAIFGGERSGHYYFKMNKYCDNAMLGAVVMLNILSADGRKLSEIIQPYMKYSSKQINIRVNDKSKVLLRVKKKYSRRKKSLVDGVSVYFKKWWFNIRASNTEPLVRLTIEAESNELLKKKALVLKKLIK